MSNFFIVLKVNDYSSILIPFSNEALEILMEAKKIKTSYDGTIIETQDSEIELYIKKYSAVNCNNDTVNTDSASR